MFVLVFGVSESGNESLGMSWIMTTLKLVVGFTLFCNVVTPCLTPSREGWNTVEVFVDCNPWFSWLR